MTIDVNNTTLFYEQNGSGRPLILLHGNGEDHHLFDKLTAKLKENYTVYAVDSRNHGQSQMTDSYAYETMAEDIRQFVLTLKLGRVNIIGFSDGAIISLILAINHGELIDKMALLGVNLKPEDFTAESYQYVKETYETTKDPLFKLMLEQPCIELAEVGAVKNPTLLIAAENDIYRPELFTELQNTLPNAELMIMAGHDHGSYIVDQDLLSDEFIRFFG